VSCRKQGALTRIPGGKGFAILGRRCARQCRWSGGWRRDAILASGRRFAQEGRPLPMRRPPCGESPGPSFQAVLPRSFDRPPSACRTASGLRRKCRSGRTCAGLPRFLGAPSPPVTASFAAALACLARCEESVYRRKTRTAMPVTPRTTPTKSPMVHRSSLPCSTIRVRWALPCSTIRVFMSSNRLF